MVTPKVIITCAVTGSAPTPGRNPAVPVTPAEIARSAVEAAEAGAAIVHIHVRDPATAAPSSDIALYKEVCERIADASDVIVNLTGGPGGRLTLAQDDPRKAGPGTTLATPEARMAHIVALRPELCSLDVATMNAADRIMVNTPDHVTAMAEMIHRAGTRAELELFDLGHISLARHLIETAAIPPPAMFQLCMGVRWGAPPTPQALMALRDALPKDVLWCAFGTGAAQFPVAAQAILLGGHVRVGLEDNIYLEHGVLAPSNAALVERVVNIATLLGAKIATSDEARAALQLSTQASMKRPAHQGDNTMNSQSKGSLRAFAN